MPYVGHQHVVSFGGLYTSVDVRDSFNSRILKGLPSYTVVAGRTKLATLTIEGVVSSNTSLSGISHTGYSTATFKGGGVGVDGVLRSLRLSGKAQSEVTFSATVEGAKTTGASSTDAPGTLRFCEDATITVGSQTLNVLSFALDLSWDVEYVYDANDSSFPYPKISETIFRSFEGELTVALNSLMNLGSSMSEVTFSIVIGGIQISGKAYESSQATRDEPEGTLTTTRRFTVSEISISME